jgi:hypothetical protein
MEDKAAGSQTVRLLLTCLDGEQCVVAFEPEGATHTLRADDAFTVLISGTGGGEVEVSHENDGITIHKWPGADFYVTNRSGQRLPT